MKKKKFLKIEIKKKKKTYLEKKLRKMCAVSSCKIGTKMKILQFTYVIHMYVFMYLNILVCIYVYVCKFKISFLSFVS